MGLSRNKVAVPEGAAGTPPFWRRLKYASAEVFKKQTKRYTRQDTGEETENKVVLHDSPQACLQFCSMILYIQRGTRVSRPAAKTGSRPAVPPEAITDMAAEIFDILDTIK